MKCVWAVLLCALMGTAAALDIGDTAPPLESGFRIQGEPIRRAEAKRLKLLTVCFFWSPGSRPCSQAVPDLNRIAAAHRDRLTMVGIGCDEAKAVAASSIARELKCPVIADTDRKLLNAFMRRIDRVPMTALLDVDGRFLWRGLPNELDAVIGAVLKGQFDLAAARRIDRLGRDFQRVMKRGDYAAAERLLDGELQFRPNHAGVIVQKARLQANERKNPRAAVATLNAAIAKTPKLYLLHEERAALLRRLGDTDALTRGAAELAQCFSGEPARLLNALRSELRRPVAEFEFGPVRELWRALDARRDLAPAVRAEVDELGARYAALCGQLERAVSLQARAAGCKEISAAQKKRFEADLTYYRRARAEQIRIFPFNQ